MKAILLSILTIASMNIFAQSSGHVGIRPLYYDVSKDSSTEFLIFNGPLSLDDLKNEPSFDWMIKGMNEYQPSKEHVNYLKQTLKDYIIVVFLGTWCDDSHNLIPKFEKVLQDINFPPNQVHRFGVDRKKNTKNGENKKYDITNVPTIIVLKDGIEKGRITEIAKISVEADLTGIISK